MATRAEERARGYQRPFARAGFPTEYAYRKARGAPLGHRSFADAERAVRARGVRDVESRISARDDQGRVTEVTVFVTGRDETTRAYVLRQRGGDRTARATFTRKSRRLARVIGTSDAPYVTYDRSRPGESGTYMDKLVEEAS